MTILMANSVGRKGIEPASYGTSELATALGMSRIAFGTALAAKYVSTSAKPDGRGHPRRFTLIDAWQFAVFFKLYQHWPRSVVTLGWLIDSLLTRDRIEFKAWSRSATADERPQGLPAQEHVADHIELVARHRGLRPAWYSHRDLEAPFRILVTDEVLEVTQSSSLFDKDGVLVNMTKAIVEVEDALDRRHRPASTRNHQQISGNPTTTAEAFSACQMARGN
jgi:hypothetical protein